MTYPRGPWRQGRINTILLWLSVGVVALWLGRALVGGFSGRGFSRGFYGQALSRGNLFLLAIALPFGGLLLWKGLTFFFWRKYFPTQSPPTPLPESEKEHRDNGMDGDGKAG